MGMKLKRSKGDNKNQSISGRKQNNGFRGSKI